MLSCWHAESLLPLLRQTLCPRCSWQSRALVSLSLPVCAAQALWPENCPGHSKHVPRTGYSRPDPPNVTCVHAGTLLSLDHGHSVHTGACHPCHMYPLAYGLCLPMPPLLCALQKCPISLGPACVCLRAGGSPVWGRWVDRWVLGRWTAGCASSLLQLLGATCRHAAVLGVGAFWFPGMACLRSPTFPRTPGRRSTLCLPPAMPQSWCAAWM